MNYKHGHSLGGATSPEYRTWRGMWARCTNPKATDYGLYGGRGVKVCDRWREFLAFLADKGPRPAGMTLDRIDAAGDYCPDNTRWATATTQVHNSSSTKLTEAAVRQIRLLGTMGYSQSLVGDWYGVSQGHVSDLVRGRKWPPKRF